MGYLLLAIASSVLISTLMRAGEKHIKNEMGMFMANYLVCAVLSLLLMENKAVQLLDISATSIWLGVISGFLYLGSFVFLKLNMKYNGMVLATTFMKLGILIPTILAVVVFHEVPRVTQVMGVVLSVFAIVLIHFEKDSAHAGSKKIWLVVLLMMSGISDAMANIFEQIGDMADKDAYLLVIFLTAFLLCLALVIYQKQKTAKTDLLLGALIGVPNYFSSRFLLLALTELDAVFVYPVYSAGTLVVLTVIGVLVFRELLSRKKACALAMIALALCLLNL